MEDFHLFILLYSNIQLNLTNVKELRLNFVYSIMEYTFLDEVTEVYCIHFNRKLQKYTVCISIGSYRRILYTFLEEVTEEYCIHSYRKLQKDSVYILIRSYRKILCSFL